MAGCDLYYGCDTVMKLQSFEITMVKRLCYISREQREKRDKRRRRQRSKRYYEVLCESLWKESIESRRLLLSTVGGT